MSSLDGGVFDESGDLWAVIEENLNWGSKVESPLSHEIFGTSSLQCFFIHHFLLVTYDSNEVTIYQS